MRKVILFNAITLDGFFAGPNGEIDWHNTDDEFNQFAIEQTSQAGGLIFGRVTYQLMESYWPTPSGIEDDPIVAGLMNSLPKYVFSRTLNELQWNNSHLLKGGVIEEVGRLKEKPGSDLFIFGSGNLAQTLLQYGLIDEYRLLVNPVILGQGMRMFPPVRVKLNLKLVNNRPFHNGNVLLSYQPVP